MRSLAGRLTWLQQLAVGGAIVLFGASAYLLASRALTSDRRSFVGETARRLAATFDEDLADESDTLEVARGLLEDGAEVGVWVEVAAHDGRVLASSIPHRDDEDGRAEHVASAANPGGIRVTAAMSDAPERRVLATLARSLAVAALPILVLTLVVGRAVARRGLRPLSIMATRAADVPIEDGVRSLGARTGVEEVDRLAESFDRLLERLDDARARERRFAADASHELRTPLNVLGGEIELLRERAAPGSRDAEPLSRASTQVAELRDLVEALLLLSRAREDAGGAHADFEVVNLCDVAREAAADALHARGLRRGDLRVAAPDECLVRGRPLLLAAAIRNLVDNALKFTSPGQRVELTLATAGHETTLAVDDAGAGVPEDERERIFDAFFRGREARAARGGFGLGLPILRRVARAHGGDVEVCDSALGGARFVLRLPAHRG